MAHAAQTEYHRLFRVREICSQILVEREGSLVVAVGDRNLAGFARLYRSLCPFHVSASAGGDYAVDRYRLFADVLH